MACPPTAGRGGIRTNSTELGGTDTHSLRCAALPTLRTGSHPVALEPANPSHFCTTPSLSLSLSSSVPGQRCLRNPSRTPKSSTAARSLLACLLACLLARRPISPAGRLYYIRYQGTLLPPHLAHLHPYLLPTYLPTYLPTPIHT
ncbi:hypothetical protein LX32DRAFT_330839 [Colletotrichum zoysiae]|uniref:Uncharacterized protein n=1 Tax=Colletotrichum zoysiae TaxID=1216348 RepID=A0AAD9HJH8_9PEZI|nr:hypothetical protein LX32DRAFT_330839 [Colletotrichum zoysiae]